MNAPPAIGFPGWAFLAFAGVALPLAASLFALTERRRADVGPGTNGPTADAHRPSRIELYIQALFTHAVLFGAAIAAADAAGVVLLPRVTVGPGDVAAAAVTLLAVLAVGEVSWRSRSPAERERLWVRRIVPHTRAERRMWILVSAGASVAEEVAYRGVFIAFAAAVTGSIPVAVVASGAAFAAVHAPQGLAGIGYVFVIALLHQALVLATGTLLLAIVVHFAYDVLAGLWLARRHGLV